MFFNHYKASQIRKPCLITILMNWLFYSKLDVCLTQFSADFASLSTLIFRISPNDLKFLLLQRSRIRPILIPISWTWSVTVSPMLFEILVKLYISEQFGTISRAVWHLKHLLFNISNSIIDALWTVCFVIATALNNVILFFTKHHFTYPWIGFNFLFTVI